jgi:hypothetical protein
MFYIVAVLAFLPCLFYPVVCVAYYRVLAYKQRQIGNILSHPGVANAFAQTRTSKTVLTPGADPAKAVESLFGLKYDWHSYVFPVAANMILLAIAIMICLIDIGLSPGFPAVVQEKLRFLPVAFFAGVAGAFIWGVYDLLDRYGDVSITPLAFHLLWLRLLAAAVMSSLVQYLAATSITPLVAFSIGAFPVQTLSDFVRGIAKDKIKLSNTESVAQPPNLQALQGTSEKTIEQLGGECIETTQQLANTEPIKLLLETNLEWAVILDLIDQAMLHMYVGDKLNDLRPLGIRGSIEFASIYSDLHSGRPEDHARGQAMCSRVAEKLDQHDGVAVEWLAATLWLDPKVKYIRQLWFGESQPENDGEAAPQPAQITTVGPNG